MVLSVSGSVLWPPLRGRDPRDSGALVKARRRGRLALRAYLLHLSHYDPAWLARKARERPIDLRLAAEVVDALGAGGFNALIVDCEDGVRYRTHPELRRPYSISMAGLARLAARARRRGLDVVPKLNFAQSARHQHNHWFRPYHDRFDDEEYWRRAFLVIDELIRACRPRRFFHVGMDEDHDRSTEQFVRAVWRLRDGLRRRSLRAVMWNDSAHLDGRRAVHAEKCLRAEPGLPRDVVQAVWDYSCVHPDIIRRLRRRGFTVWGAPGRTAALVQRWRAALLRHGGSGVIMTNWIACRPANRTRLLEPIETLGRLYGP